MKKTILPLRLVIVACLLAVGTVCHAAAGHLRRPISPEQPAWIIHIDVWNYADPQKIIDMVPEDVRPYVIFNIATSSTDEKSADGPAIYDSWMKVCAQNRVWTLIQCASGAVNRMPDTPDDVSAYEQYFKDYPNFLGFNFAEQFWGFGSDGRATFPERLQLFAKLLPLCKTYGGYLVASFTDSYYNASKMPMAWLKRNADIRSFLSSDADHFLCFEKFTQKKNFLDIESNCLGQWLGGYAGQYGIRFDSSGWVADGDKPDSEGHTHYTLGTADFVRAAGAIPIAEHMMLTGQTMMDGPELTWKECSVEASTTTVDGYLRRNWEWFPQFNNISLDLFRKILDGTIRILTRQEVIDRTKVCLVNDVSVSNVENETERTPYITPEKLFDGLYRHACDQGGRDAENHWIENHWWMKSTGRYPTIPHVYSAVSGMKAFQVSSYSKSEFDAWMNEHFTPEYTGTIYAGRQENGWVTYNPYQYDDVTDANGIRTLGKATKRATGNIPFQYNTCASVDLDYAPYSLGIMKEYADRLTFYLSNYQNGEVSKDIIKINGASAKPSFTKEDRGSGTSSTVTEQWENGVYTLTVSHDGPLDLAIHCAGSATGRQTSYTTASVSEPALPAVYTGTLQYEAELADYKSVTIRKSGYNLGRDGYQGQGFAEMSGNSSSLRYHVSVPETSYYQVTLRYQSTAAGSVTVATGSQSVTAATTTASQWTEATATLLLTEGQHAIDVMNSGGKPTYMDCLRLTPQETTVINETSGTAAVIPATVTGANVSYTRQLAAPQGATGDVTLDGAAAKLYTICLPYTPVASPNLRYYSLERVDGETLVFAETSDVKAFTPYLVAATGSGSTSIGNETAQPVDFDSPVTDGTAHDGYQLKGTLRGLSNTDAQGFYILQTGNTWGRVTASAPSVYIPPFRAYIVASTGSGTPLRSAIGGGDDTTGIRHIQTHDADGSVHWYDLQGRSIVPPTRKGLYIRDGKKVLVR